MPVYDTQFQIDYYRPVRKDRILFGGQGTGTNWSAERINDYLLGRFRTVFPHMKAWRWIIRGAASATSR